MVAKAQASWLLIVQLVLWDTLTRKSFCSKPQDNKDILGPLLNVCKVRKWVTGKWVTGKWTQCFSKRLSSFKDELARSWKAFQKGFYFLWVFCGNQDGIWEMRSVWEEEHNQSHLGFLLHCPAVQMGEYLDALTGTGSPAFVFLPNK